ncbi:MAG: TetR/AcrR family transcriptional regulator [Thermoleophilia bacterium]
MSTTSRQETERHPANRGDLSREELVTAAIQIVDTEGLDKLTMRRLALKLRCGTMTLYGHVADREDLIEGITERILDEIDFHTEPEDTWVDLLRRSSRSYWAMVCRHPVAFRLVALSLLEQPAVAKHMARATEVLQGVGLSLENALTLLGVADAYATGFFLARSSVLSGEEAPGRPHYELSDADRIARRLNDMVTEGHWEQGTEIIIAGFGQQLARNLPAEP